MKLNVILIGALSGAATAFPGLKGLMTDLAKRQGPPNVPAPLIGDLKTQGGTTAVGKQVLNCIQGTGPCELNAPKARFESLSTIMNGPILTLQPRPTGRLDSLDLFLAVPIPAAFGTMSLKTWWIHLQIAMELVISWLEPLFGSDFMMLLPG